MRITLVVIMMFTTTALGDEVLPPDLVHVTYVSCGLVEYGVATVYDAKSKEPREVTKWRVEPSASYDDHRPVWHLPTEVVPFSHAERPGAIADNIDDEFSALTVCKEWREKAKKAVVDAKRKAAKDSKK